jgi:hypothetical protein
MGDAEIAPKKLKGARFGVPSAERVETQPIGRGTTSEVRS